MSKRIRKFVEPYLVTNGSKFRLKAFDPDDHGSLKASKDAAASLLEEGVSRLCALQEKLYAQDQWGVLLIFQAMDAAGKDGAIKHVLSGVNPQGCQITSFKQPSSEDLDHDFMWRCLRKLPERVGSASSTARTTKTRSSSASIPSCWSARRSRGRS